MANYNKVLLMGNLTKDPELRYTPQGTAVANLGLAVNRKYLTKDKESKQDVLFITVIVWSKQAETCNQYLHKGSSCFVEGRLQLRSWEDKTGAKRSVIEVVAERVQFMGAPGGPSAKAPEQVSQLHSEALVEEPTSESTWLAESEDGTHEG